MIELILSEIIKILQLLLYLFFFLIFYVSLSNDLANHYDSVLNCLYL